MEENKKWKKEENENETVIDIRPQQWYQEKVLSSKADIVVWWWNAWAWKTFSLLLDPMRWTSYKTFRWVIFRRQMTQIKWGWWLWDESLNLYPYLWWEPLESKAKWRFKSWAEIAFSHLEYEKDKLSHQWLQYAFIWFDELTQFSKSQFLYLLIRNRSTCWTRPYIRATCNPDAESWVKDLIEWWLDEEWYPIPERDWIIRYLTIDKNNFIWWETQDELIKKCPHLFNDLIKNWKDPAHLIKTFTFIKWSLDENKILSDKDPAYKWNLLAQEEEIRKALLEWCWKAVQDDKAIVDYNMLACIFTNHPKENNKKTISCDVAWFWQDLAIVMTWIWWNCIKMQIFTKSWPDLLKQTIESERKQHNIPIKNVAVDNDWMWWGLVDMWYISFNWWKPALEDPNTKVKENYKNLKTQCAYILIQENINTWEFNIDLENIYVDWFKSKQVRNRNKIYDIEKLIKDNFKAIKRDKTDIEGKLHINTKEEQKNILWWLSPDFFDCCMMNKIFDLEPEKKVVFF